MHSAMSAIARGAGRALKVYCAVFLALVLVGLSGNRLPVWPFLVVLSTDVTVAVLRVPVVGALLLAVLLLGLVLRWRSVPTKPVVGSIFLAAVSFSSHYVATVGLVAAPRHVAVMAAGLIVSVALVRRRMLARLVRARALWLACGVFLPLAAMGFRWCSSPRRAPSSRRRSTGWRPFDTSTTLSYSVRPERSRS